MKFTAQQIATVVQGEIAGDPNSFVNSFSKIEESKEGDLCFFANAKYEDYLYDAKATIILINKDFELKKPVKATLIRVNDAYAAFALLLQTYQDIFGNKKKQIIEQPSFIATKVTIPESTFVGAFAYIDENVKLGTNVQIHSGVYLGSGVSVGDNTILYSGVKIYPDCKIGSNVIIHSGTVIGSDGFGFAFENGAFKKIPQIGNVVVEDDVEIGANCTIDRATMGSTKIGKGSKLDNLIQIAHNVEIGQNTVIAAQAGISGSTKIGNYVMIGGQAGIVGHIKIADQTKINAQSGVAKEIILPGTSLTGSPAFEYKSSLKSQVVYKHLPELQKRVNELEQKMKQLNQQ